jgi:hypothetical protein
MVTLKNASQNFVENLFNTNKKLVFKIKYKLNLLPETGIHALRKYSNNEESIEFQNENISILNLCTSLEEIDVFLTETLQEII